MTRLIITAFVFFLLLVTHVSATNNEVAKPNKADDTVKTDNTDETTKNKKVNDDKRVYFSGVFIISNNNKNEKAFDGNYPGTSTPINDWDPGARNSNHYLSSQFRLDAYVALSNYVSFRTKINSSWTSLTDTDNTFNTDVERAYFNFYTPKAPVLVTAGWLPTTYGASWLAADAVIPKSVANVKSRGILSFYELDPNHSSKAMLGWLNVKPEYSISLPSNLYDSRSYNSYVAQFSTRLHPENLYFIADYVNVRKFPLIYDFLDSTAFGSSNHSVYNVQLNAKYSDAEVYIHYARSMTALAVDAQGFPSLTGKTKKYSGNAVGVGLSKKLGKGNLSIEYTYGTQYYFNPLSTYGSNAFSIPTRISWSYPPTITLAALPYNAKNWEISYTYPIAKTTMLALDYQTTRYMKPAYGAFAAPTNHKADCFSISIAQYF